MAVLLLGEQPSDSGWSRLAVRLRRLCSIKTLHRVPRLAASLSQPCESYCAIASRPVHHARLRSTPALDLASRGVSSGRPSQAFLPSGRLSTRLEWCPRPPACRKLSTPDRPLRHPGPQATSSARPAAPAVHACRLVLFWLVKFAIIRRKFQHGRRTQSAATRIHL